MSDKSDHSEVKEGGEDAEESKAGDLGEVTDQGGVSDITGDEVNTEGGGEVVTDEEGEIEQSDVHSVEDHTDDEQHSQVEPEGDEDLTPDGATSVDDQHEMRKVEGDLSDIAEEGALEFDELPREDDMTAEQLELDQPLDDWVSNLVPSMRDIIAPQFDDSPPLESPVPEEEVIPVRPCPIPEVLLSDSPMMQRFQATLRAHLLRQKERLENDLFEMERECSKKDHEIRTIGVTINREQEHLVKQKDMLEKYKCGIQEVTNKRKQYDNALSKKKVELKETATHFKETVKEDKSLFNQYEEMTELAHQLSLLEKTQSAELQFSKNMSEKQKADTIRIAQDKQKQDLYIWKLTHELEMLNMETNALIEETTDKKCEISQLTQLITDIEADTEALRKENQMIISATQQLVLEIKQRDSGLLDATTRLNAAQSQLQLVVTRIRSYNKSLLSERERQSSLSSAKNKLEIIIQRNEHQDTTLKAKYDSTLERLAHIQNMIDSVELQNQANNNESNDMTMKYKNLTVEMDELTMKRVNLKNRYMGIMAEMKIQSAVTKKLHKCMEELSHENQDIGLQKLEIDCKIGELMTEIEQAKVRRVQQELKIDNLKNKIRDQESQIRSMEVHKKKIQQQIQTYRSKVIGSNRRLETLLKFNDLSESRNLLVRRVNVLKQDLIEMEERITDYKNSWMETQNNLIEQTYRLSQLESTTNTFRKHLYLTKYKREKLEAKMAESEAELRKASKDFCLYHNKLTSMTMEHYKHEQNKDKLVDIAMEAEVKYVSVLKEGEEYAVRLQLEICNLEEGNTDMEDEVSQLQREFLAWEKKWQMAVEAKERVEKERATTGEIGAMKLEIHRMQVRYGQLKKVQEKLSQDLELSISRRDNIVDLAQAKEKRSAKGCQYTKQQFAKKLETTRNKIKQLQSAIRNAEKEIEELELRREELMDEFMEKQKQLVEVKQGVDKLETEIQEGQLHKYKSLELVVRRQRKIRLLDEIKHSRYRLFYRNESNLTHEEEKQHTTNSNILQVVQSLISDFPKLKLQLLQIYNTLTVPIDC